MCIIAISKKGIRQPNEKEIRNMFSRNSHGAGYMVARGDKVELHKGFMDVEEFLWNVNRENFTDDDVVIYHFRISTQAGVNREMCHPFALTSDISKTKALDAFCGIGVAHNGIIPMTTSKDAEYSDTAHFVAEYLPLLIRNTKDMRNPRALELIEEAIQSKMALLDGSGYVATVGNFITEKSGLMFSNTTYKEITSSYVKFSRTEEMFDRYSRPYKFH